MGSMKVLFIFYSDLCKKEMSKIKFWIADRYKEEDLYAYL
jgi:hypothetical protein